MLACMLHHRDHSNLLKTPQEDVMALARLDAWILCTRGDASSHRPRRPGSLLPILVWVGSNSQLYRHVTFGPLIN
jgi:hypothetical protein